MTKEQVLMSNINYKGSSRDVFNGIGCLDGTFSLQVKLDSRPYQVPMRCIAYALQKPFKEVRVAPTTRHH